MRAVFIRRFGGVEVLEYGECPDPQPGPRDVLVSVRAASINPRDWLIRSGRYPFQRLLPKLPFILGSDISGTVEAVGAKVRRFRLGDEVFGMQPTSAGFGGYAEKISIRETALAKKPAGMSHQEAAGVPLAALTALQALRSDARLRTEERLLVIGASGGVGHYAVQIGKILGAHVTGVCSTRNLDMVRELGADEVIDYTAENFLHRNAIWDVIFDTIGKESLSRCADVLSPCGTYVTTIPRWPMFREAASSRLRRLITRHTQRARVVLLRASGKQLAEICAWIEEGRFKTCVDQTFPLSEAAAAHESSRTFRTRGKLILTLD